MPSPSSSVRSLPYPSLENGNFSFPDGDYDVTTKVPDGVSRMVTLFHKVSNAPFIERLIDSGEAKFACLIAVPKTGYRQLCISDTNVQEITWDLDVAGEPPILGPVVLFVGVDKSHTFTDSDGVASVWLGKKIDLPKGARLARSNYLRPSISIESLLSVRHKPELPNGNFTVTANSNEGFYFTMHAATDIFEFVQNSQGRHDLRASILTHAVSQCFSILKSDYCYSKDDEETDDHWEQYPSLTALSDWLESNGMPHWSDERFDAVNVATRLYPIRIPKLETEE